jgi:DNA polymerase-3 subunit gamma/tau
LTYQPLATKYRPSRFSELVGQESTSKALANAIKMGREAHAVIFTGVRGVGKTTVARLYAKSLNCENLSDASEPCNQCESCRAITLGCHEDVMEIDGASNTGVADVRALQETIEYVPQRSKFKVYIIDEVHMLSQAAFNALLKTLEEPPSHIVFVFATTELHKVPQTILSRCQSFYLKKLPTALIIKRLVDIFSKEGIKFDDKAVAVIAREGHGSMRDALTLADQAIALGQGNVTTDVLSNMISNLSSSPYLELLLALAERNFERVASSIAELDQGGVEFIKLVEEVAGFSRHAFIVQGIGINAIDTALLGLDDLEISKLETIAKTAKSFDLNRIFRTLMKCREELDGSALDRFIVENYLFEWCFDPGLPSVEDLLGGTALPLKKESGAVHSEKSASADQTPRMNTGSMREMLAEMRQKQQVSSPEKKSESQLAPIPVSPTLKSEFPLPQKQLDKNPEQGPRRMQGATSGAAKDASEYVQQSKTVEPLSSDKNRFPSTWRQLIDTWKREKPLQARKLEEVHPLSYSPEKIMLAVPEEGLAGRQLLQKDEQVKITALFRELFDFKGVLTFIPRSQAIIDATNQNQIDLDALDPALPTIATKAQLSAPVASMPIALETDPAPSHAPISQIKEPLQGATAQPHMAPSTHAEKDELLPETVRREKMRESEIARQKKIEECRNAPITLDLLAALNASIESVRLQGHQD